MEMAGETEEAAGDGRPSRRRRAGVNRGPGRRAPLEFKAELTSEASSNLGITGSFPHGITLFDHIYLSDNQQKLVKPAAQNDLLSQINSPLLLCILRGL